QPDSVFVSTYRRRSCARVHRAVRGDRSLPPSGPMPRKPSSSRPSTPASPSAADAKRAPTLPALRGEIDRIDKDLVALLNRRAELALQIGMVKQKQGLEVWSPAREEEVVNRALMASQGPMPPET